MKALRFLPWFLAILFTFTACRTVEPEAADNRMKGYVVPSGPGVIWGRVLLAAGGMNDKRFVTDADGGLANVFVRVSRGLENRSFDAPATPVVIEGGEEGFNPPVAGALTGQRVVWKSTDPRGRNVRSRPNVGGNRPFESLLLPNVTVETVYRSPELFLRHETDGSPSIAAHLCVVEHPFFAVTDEHGMFALPAGLPPGSYSVTARHLDAGEAAAELSLGVDAVARVEFELGAADAGFANRVKSVNVIAKNQPRVASQPTVKLIEARPVHTLKLKPQPAPVQVARPAPTAKPRVQNVRLALPEARTRVFQVNSERLLKGLRASYSGDAETASLQALLGQAIGKSKSPEPLADPFPGVVLNADAGVLQVRAPKEELERIAAVVELLDRAPAQVAIDARILEVDVRDFDRYIDSHPVYSQTLNNENFAGVLPEAEYRAMLQRLAEMKGARLIHAPGVATLSGSTVEIRFDPTTKLDIGPTVSPDKGSVEMEILFATFADEKDKTPEQSLKTTARAMSRQTVMLGGLAKGDGKSAKRSSRDKTVLLLLITPTTLDDSGNP